MCEPLKFAEGTLNDAEPWREWRAESEGLTWRVALPEDMPAIHRMWKAKEVLLGVKCLLPDLFAPPVVLTLVAEDGRGHLVDGVFLEAIIDVTKLGGNPKGFASLTDPAVNGPLAAFLKARKFRRVTAAMPERIAVRMAGGLVRAGFRVQMLALWDRWI